MEHESESYTKYNWCARYSQERIGTRTGRLGNKGMNGDHLNYSNTEIDQNTKKCPEGLRRLDVTQTPVKNHQLTLVRRTLK